MKKYIGKMCTFDSDSFLDDEGSRLPLQGVAISENEFMLYDGEIVRGSSPIIIPRLVFPPSEKQRKVLKLSP